jgi:hypothetical protein
VKVVGGFWTSGDWQSATDGGEGTLWASLRSRGLNRVRKALMNGIATRGRRGDRSGVSVLWLILIYHLIFTYSDLSTTCL